MTNYPHPANSGGYGGGGFGPPPGPPPYGPPPTGGPRNVPWWQSWWAIALLALIIGIGIGAASAGGSSKNSASPSRTITATVSSVATLTQPAGTVTATPIVTRVVQTKTRTVTETFTPPPTGVFSDGLYKIGTDIKPGAYRTDGSDGGGDCYYERESNLSGSIDSIITNDNFTGPSRIQVNRGEYLKVSGGCEWRRA